MPRAGLEPILSGILGQCGTIRPSKLSDVTNIPMWLFASEVSAHMSMWLFASDYYISFYGVSPCQINLRRENTEL